MRTLALLLSCVAVASPGLTTLHADDLARRALDVLERGPHAAEFAALTKEASAVMAARLDIS